MNLSDTDISHIWSSYHENLKTLETFDHAETGKKKIIIEKIRDNVTMLVESGHLPIQKKQIANYVFNQLYERNIKYSKGHFYDLFSEDQKLKHSKSSRGNSHTHNWKIISKSDKGTWKNCECGANTINDILQQDAISQQDNNNNNDTIPLTVLETIPPQGLTFEILDNFLEISQNNTKIIKMLKQKTSMNKSLIEKQISKRSTTEQQERKANITNQIKIKSNVIKTEFEKLGTLEKTLNESKSIITLQIYALSHLNDRTTLTHFEKIMARVAVALGYDKSDIARFLHITTRHIKLNIIEKNHERRAMLQKLEWFGRCPNPACGITLKDYFELKIKQNKLRIGESKEYEYEPLLISGYQSQVLDLQQKLKLQTMRKKKPILA